MQKRCRQSNLTIQVFKILGASFEIWLTEYAYDFPRFL